MHRVLLNPEGSGLEQKMLVVQTGRNMSTRTIVLQLGVMAVLISSLSAQTRNTDAPSLASIVQRMELAQARIQGQNPYQSVRQYRLFGSQATQPSSEVIATVSSSAEGKDYRIEKQTGNSRGEQVVRRILDHEVQDSTQPIAQRSGAITSDNYEFAYVGESSLSGRPCYLLHVSPKRKDKALIVGQIWVDRDSFLVRRIEGDMVKSPSWWLKSVHVQLSFDSLQGTWVQTNMEAIADARLVGLQTLKSETVDLRNGGVVAAASSSTLGARRKSSIQNRIPAELLLQPLNRR